MSTRPSIVVCQQPNYFPWLGYIEQCARADKLIILDSVQWIRRGLQHRTKILPHLTQKTEQDFQWLTLPVHHHGHREKPLGELLLNREETWTEHHWKTLVAIYGKRPQFTTQLEPLLRPWFETATQFHTLAEATVSSMELCFKALDLTPEVLWSSKLDESGIKTDRIASLCQAVDGEIYYSGLASSSYLDPRTLEASNIRLVWQRWKCDQYEQGRPNFRSHLSIIDALANVPISEIKGWLEIKPWGPFGDLFRV